MHLSFTTECNLCYNLTGDFMKDFLIEKNVIPYIEEAGILYSFHANQSIYFQEDISNNFYFIKKGRVRVYLINQDGKEMTIEIMGEGRVFGESSFFSRSARLTSVTAVNDVELIACQIEDLMPYLNHSPELVTQIFILLSQTVKHLSHQVRRLCFMNAYEKVADFLLEMTDHPHKSLNITCDTIPYTHQEIAECTSLQRVTVTKILNKFKQSGWIELKYRAITIVKREELKIFAYKNI